MLPCIYIWGQLICSTTLPTTVLQLQEETPTTQQTTKLQLQEETPTTQQTTMPTENVRKIKRKRRKAIRRIRKKLVWLQNEIIKSHHEMGKFTKKKFDQAYQNMMILHNRISDKMNEKLTKRKIKYGSTEKNAIYLLLGLSTTIIGAHVFIKICEFCNQRRPKMKKAKCTKV